LLFVNTERTRIITDRVWGAPDLVAEILSPKPRIGTLEERLGWFAQYGIRECWLIRQDERELDVLEFDGHHLMRRRTFERNAPIRSCVLPGFRQSLEQIIG
jgi:Uma2 family endonuclease